METLLTAEGQDNSRKCDLRSSLCYYLSLIMVLLAFIFSCVSLGFCSAEQLQNKMYSYDFPFVSDFLQFEHGMPVSIDWRGNAWPGAGTTIYRNITDEVIDYEMTNVKLQPLNWFMTLAVYDGGVTAFRGTWEGFETEVRRAELPTLHGEVRRVSGVVKLTENTFLVVSPSAVMPLTAEVTRNEGGRVSVQFFFGNSVDLPEDGRYPHFDTLDNTTLAMIYERHYLLYVCTVKVSGTGSSMTVTYGNPQMVCPVYEFHKVAGLDERHFVITATGRMYNITGYPPIVTTTLVTVENDGSLTVGMWKTMTWTFSHNFMGLDNLDRNDVVMTFVDGTDHSIRAVIIFYDREADEVFFGPSKVLQSGGAVLYPERIDLRVLGDRSFTVFYEDQAINGLALVHCKVTDSRDIAIISPTFVIDRYRWGRAYYDLCPSGRSDFVMIEYIDSGREKRAMMHYGVVAPRPFGIAQKTSSKRLTVQFAGMFKVKGNKRFTPGRAVYTNSKGELFQGRPYGSANRERGLFYTVAEDGSLITQNNLIGMAVTRNKIYMKFY